MQLSLCKIALLADLHLSMSDMAAGRTNDGLPIRLTDKLTILRSVLASLEEKGVKVVVILGDIFETPDASDFLKRLFYESLIECDSKMIVILGNHDYSSESHYNFSADKILIANYGLQERFLIVDKPQTINRVTLVPWMPEDELVRYFEIMSSPDCEKSEVLLGHFGVSGCKVSEYDSTHVGEISTRYLAPYRKVFLGHYHLPQKYYIGSLFRNHHGEANYDCGYVILDLTSLESERISVQDRNFLTLRIDADKGESLGSAVSKYRAGIQEYLRSTILKGSIVKVRIVGHRESIPLVDKVETRKVLTALGAIAVSFDHEYLRDEESSILVSNDFVRSGSMKQIFSAYCQARKVESSIVDRAQGFLND